MNIKTMKFYIYNPEPAENCTNPSCSRFHSKTQNHSHIYDCYGKVTRSATNFQCSNRVLKLAEPHPRHSNKIYHKGIRWPLSKNNITKKYDVSTRLEHLSAPIFRRVYATRQFVDPHTKVQRSVKENLNSQIQRSMYSLYSRLENVKLPNRLDWKR